MATDFEEGPKPANNSDVLRFLTRMVIEKQKENEEKQNTRPHFPPPPKPRPPLVSNKAEDEDIVSTHDADPQEAHDDNGEDINGELSANNIYNKMINKECY